MMESADQTFGHPTTTQLSVSGPDLPNVTLVDQPGLVAPKPGSSMPETVERIVKRNANASGSLILNVVPLEQARSSSRRNRQRRRREGGRRL